MRKEPVGSFFWLEEDFVGVGITYELLFEKS